MKLKEEEVCICSSRARGSNQTPLKFRLHYDIQMGEYVLCRRRLFGISHIDLEEAKDMVKILEQATKLKEEKG